VDAAGVGGAAAGAVVEAAAGAADDGTAGAEGGTGGVELASEGALAGEEGETEDADVGEGAAETGGEGKVALELVAEAFGGGLGRARRWGGGAGRERRRRSRAGRRRKEERRCYRGWVSVARKNRSAHVFNPRRGKSPTSSHRLAAPSPCVEDDPMGAMVAGGGMARGKGGGISWEGTEDMGATAAAAVPNEAAVRANGAKLIERSKSGWVACQRSARRRRSAWDCLMKSSKWRTSATEMTLSPYAGNSTPNDSPRKQTVLGAGKEELKEESR